MTIREAKMQSKSTTAQLSIKGIGKLINYIIYLLLLMIDYLMVIFLISQLSYFQDLGRI